MKKILIWAAALGLALALSGSASAAKPHKASAIFPRHLILKNNKHSKKAKTARVKKAPGSFVLARTTPVSK